jgi:hypothetical protein
MKGISPVWLAPDVNFVAIGVDLSNYATNTDVALKANQATTYTKTEVDTQFSSLIDSAPTALNTLKELANALANDANYATTVQNQLATKANTTYVDEQFALKTFPWFSNSEPDGTGYRYIDTGPGGLVIRSGQPAMQILGTDNWPLEGKVMVYKGMSVGGSFDINGVNVITALGTKANQATTYTKTEVDTAISNITIPTNISVSTIDGDAITDNVNITAHVIVEKNFAVNGATANMNGNLNVGGALATNSISGNGANVITVNDNLVITGNLTVQGSTSISGGSSNPFWVAGRVNGTNLSILKSNGRYGFTVTRPSGFATGVYRIAFSTPTPDANYVISVAILGTGTAKVWESTDAAGRIPTTTSFHVVSMNQSFGVANFDFYFSVFV